MSLVSFPGLSLRDVLGIPSTQLPIDGTTFASYVFPVSVFQFAAAMLAVMPQTRTIQVALWPLVALFALRAALSVDMSLGKAENRFNTANFMLLMLSIAARSLEWTLVKGPFVRDLRPASSAPSTVMDALDLICNFRGLGWDWSGYRSYMPRETRPANRTAFVFCTFLSAAAHALISGVFHRAILTLVPVDAGSVPGASTIFDDTLPLPARYLRSSVISTFTAIVVYSSIQMAYDLCTLPAVLFLGHDPAQWPPAFNAPWRASSLCDLWGRRWHQFLRHMFVLGGYPLSLVFGSSGTVIGTFLASGLWHQLTLMTLNPQVEMWWMLVGFGMMGPGVLAERAFRRMTGKRVGGVLGWIWAMTWLLVWGHLIVEGFARGGIFTSLSPLDSVAPLRPLVVRLMIDFNTWLHTA